MKNKIEKKEMIRDMAYVAFITCPAMLLSGYGVYVLRKWLVSSGLYEMPDIIFLFLFLFICKQKTLN